MSPLLLERNKRNVMAFCDWYMPGNYATYLFVPDCAFPPV